MSQMRNVHLRGEPRVLNKLLRDYSLNFMLLCVLEFMMCVRIGIPLHTQDNFFELLLTFHLYAGSKDGTQANRIVQIEPLNTEPSHLV